MYIVENVIFQNAADEFPRKQWVKFPLLWPRHSLTFTDYTFCRKEREEGGEAFRNVED